MARLAAIDIVALVNALLGLAYNIYDKLAQVSGDIPIPTWEELTNKNAILQAKIDAEKLL